MSALDSEEEGKVDMVLSIVGEHHGREEARRRLRVR